MSAVAAFAASLRRTARNGGAVFLPTDLVRLLADELEASKAATDQATVEIGAVRAAQDAADASAMRARLDRQTARNLNKEARLLHEAAEEKRAAARRDRRFAWRLVWVQAAMLAVFVAAQIWWGMR